MQRIAPEDKAGFRRLDASIAPPNVRTAPITVWISSDEQYGTGNSRVPSDLLQTLFEITAVARTGQQRSHVERKDRVVDQRFRHLAFDDALGQSFGNRGFADAWIADIERVVLGAAAKYLDGTVDLVVATDQRIDASVSGLVVEVDAIGLQSILLLFCA